MRIFVSGATGFLGRFLCASLKRQGHEVMAVGSRSCDLTQGDPLSAYDEISFDQIYHLAAWTQAGDFCLSHPGEQWIINQKINTRVLEWWQQKQPQAKLICIGTSCGYAPDRPLEEQYYLQGEPVAGLFTYAMTKRMLLCGLMALHQQYGMQYLYLIPSTLYGPKYPADGRQMHFIFDLMQKILKGQRYGEDVVLWGDGYQKREIIHVEDFVVAALQLAEEQSNTLINIGTGIEHSIREFAEVICKRVGFSSENISFDTSKYVGVRSKVLNINKLKTLLPAFHPRPVEQGIAETIEWLNQLNL